MMSPSSTNRLDRQRLYHMMRLIRRIEETLIAEYHPADEMRCPMHFCVGQESAPAALAQLLRPADVLMSHYRSHGYYLAKGGSLDEMVAEFYGKANGANGGLAGSMELASHEMNFFSGAIVGGSVIVPLGAAFAQRYAGRDDISISVVGDGSFDEGVFYEAMNLAALHKLPLLILCENNKYAANSEIAKRLGRPELLPKADAMGIPGEILDGYQLDHLFDALANAVAAVRSGSGPRYVEVVIYRFCAHVGPQPDDYLEYRAVSEIDAHRAKDPLVSLRRQLVENDAAEILAMDAAIEREIMAAIAAAKAAPFPSPGFALQANLANSYAPIAEEYFRDLAPTFRGGQNETKLEPF